MQTMLLKRPLKDVGPWRGIFEPSTVTSFTERERVVEKHGLPGARAELFEKHGLHGAMR